MPLKLGLFSMTTGPCTYPDGAARVARAAEAAGFDSLWGGEHVVLPDPRVPPSPMEPEDRIMDPVVTLAFVAALGPSLLTIIVVLGLTGWERYTRVVRAEVPPIAVVAAGLGLSLLQAAITISGTMSSSGARR